MLKGFFSKHDEIVNLHRTQLLRHHNRQIKMIHKAEIYVNHSTNNICVQINCTPLYFDNLPIKINETQSLISASKTALYLLMGSFCIISFMLRWETLPCCFEKERQPMKQMSGWEEHVLDDNRCTYMKQLACVICLLKKRQFITKQTTIKKLVRIAKCTDKNEL